MAMIDCAQQSVQWTVGILRHFRAFPTFGLFSALKVFSRPTLTNVTFNGNAGSSVIYNINSSHPVLRNVTMWGDSATSKIYSVNSSNPTISYSDIQGCGNSDSWNSASVHLDCRPGLGGRVGGATPTAVVEDVQGVCTVAQDSSCTTTRSIAQSAGGRAEHAGRGPGAPIGVKSGVFAGRCPAGAGLLRCRRRWRQSRHGGS